IDVAGGELSCTKQLETPARAAAHADRLVEVRREALYCGVVETIGRRIAQPYPTGLDAEQFRHASQRLAGSGLFGGRAVERLGNLLNHAERARLRQPSRARAPLLRLGHTAMLQGHRNLTMKLRIRN